MIRKYTIWGIYLHKLFNTNPPIAIPVEVENACGYRKSWEYILIWTHFCVYRWICVRVYDMLYGSYALCLPFGKYFILILWRARNFVRLRNRKNRKMFDKLIKCEFNNRNSYIHWRFHLYMYVYVVVLPILPRDLIALIVGCVIVSKDDSMFLTFS